MTIQTPRRPLLTAAALLLASSPLAHAAPPPGFTPAGNELEVVSDPQTGREVRFLTSGEHTDATFYATQTTWTNDGRYVFFESDRPHPQGEGDAKDWQLMAADADSGDLFHVAPIPFRPGHGTQALEYRVNLHAGRGLLYIVDRSGTRVYTHRLADGTTQLVHTMPEGTIIKMSPSFSCDGEKLAVVIAWPGPHGNDEKHNGWEYGVEVRDILDDTGRLSRPELVATQMGLKPDGDTPGKTISHAEFNPTDPTLLAYKVAEDLWTVRADGSELQHRYGYDGRAWRGHQSWSADGLRMNFVDNGDLAAYSLADSSTSFYAKGLDPEAWHQDSNDSPLFVYDHRDAGTVWDEHDNRPGSIVMLDTRDGDTTTLCATVFSKLHPRHPHPQFSPGGDRIAFTHSHEDRSRVAVTAVPEPLTAAR